MIALLLECKAGLTIQSKQVKQRYQIENRSRFNKVTSALMDGRAPSQEIMDLMKALMKERRGENIVETVMPIMPEVFQEAASPSSTFVAPAKIVKPRQIVSKPTTLAAQIDKIATVSIPTPNLNIARKIDGKKFTINPKMFAKKRKIIE